MATDIIWDEPSSEIVWDEPTVEPPKQKRSALDELKRQLGLTLRAGVTGATAAGGAIADFGVGAANLMGADLPIPSQALQRQLSKFGVPEPETAPEHIAGFGASVLAGGMDPVLNATQKVAAQLAPKGFVSAKHGQGEVTKELHDAGYVFPPSEMRGGAVTRGLEGLGNKTHVAQLAQDRNQQVSQSLAKRALKLPETVRLDAATLKQHADDLIETGYRPLRQIGVMRADASYNRALDDITNKFQSRSFPRDTQQQIANRVDRLRVKAFDSDDAIDKISQLRTEAGDQFKPGGDTNYGRALRDMARAIENAMERSLVRRGRPAAELLSNFRESRTMLAKNHAVERMLVDPSTGIISTTKAHQLLRSKVPLSDGLEKIAKAGSPMYSRATGVPTAGEGVPINFTDSVFAGGGLAGAPFTGGASLPLAALPGVRGAARSAVLSGPMQSRLARNLTPQPSMFGAPADVIKSGIPAHLLPMFSSGEM